MYYCLENIELFLDGKDELDEETKSDIIERAKEEELSDGLILDKSNEYIFDDEELQEEFETALAQDPEQLDILEGLGEDI